MSNNNTANCNGMFNKKRLKKEQVNRMKYVNKCIVTINILSPTNMLLRFTSLFQALNTSHDRNRKTSLARQESTSIENK